MKIGFSVSTPHSRLIEQCQMWATLAMHDALRKGPVCFCRLN